MSIVLRLRELKGIPSSESQVAQFILEYPREVLKMNSRTLAKKTYTSPSTVIRLCQRVGAEGFPDLKVRLAMELDAFLEHSDVLVENYDITKYDTIDTIASKFLSFNIESLHATEQIMDVASMAQAVALIKEKNVIDFYGVGASSLVAKDAYSKFLRLGKMVSAHGELDHQKINAQLSDKNHLAVLISYTGETAQIIDIAHILTKKRTTIISITNAHDNTLAELSDLPLYITSKESKYRVSAMSSRTSMFYLMDVLFAAYINLDYEKNMERISQTYIPK